jgi:hypothetical protein
MLETIERGAKLTRMSSLRVQCLAMSLDGFIAGPGQAVNNPLGIVASRALV